MKTTCSRQTFAPLAVALAAGMLPAMAAGVASAQTPMLIDLNPYSTSSANSSPSAFARLQTPGGERVVFAANDGTNGTELWITDGTAAGTMLLADILPGSGSGSPQTMTSFGTRVVFSATTTNEGRELWITDGTAAGTTLLANINPGVAGGIASGTSRFGVVGDFATPGSFVVFPGTNGLTGTELFVYSPAGGVSLLREINATGAGGANSSLPSGFSTVGTTVYFLASNGTSVGLQGNELWSTDGTFAGTTRLTDFAAGTVSSGFSLQADLNGYGYGAASTSTAGSEPTAINLATNTPIALGDLNSGSGNSTPTEFVVVDNPGTAADAVFFRATRSLAGGGTDVNLYRVTFDGLGVPNGAMMFDINTTASPNDNVGSLVVFNGQVYFAANDGATGRELWKIDPATNTLSQVADINIAGDSAPTNPLVSGSRLFFSAINAPFGREPYVFDGTTVTPLGDLRQDQASSMASGDLFFALGSTTLFSASDTIAGQELFGTDGTPAGTDVIEDIRPQTGNTGSAPTNLTAVDGRLFFSANDEGAGREPWTSDGTFAGSDRVADIAPGSGNSSPYLFTPFGGDVVFAANNGTGSGQTGIEYYRGTPTGATLLADINPGTGSSAPGSGTAAVLNGVAYFQANDGVSGSEVWAYDGINPPTLFADLNANAGGSSAPGNFATIGSFVYFSAGHTGAGGFGIEPYRTDGASTSLIENLAAGTTASSPSQFFGFGNDVFFRANDGTGIGNELFVFDPAIPDALLVQDIRPGSNSSNPGPFAQVNGTLCFLASDTGGNIQLYTATKTPGSAVVKSAAIGSTIATLVKSGDYVYFNAGNLVGTNVELWAYDGGAGMAFPIEINPSGGSFPTGLIDVNGVLYFGAVGATGGNELYRVTFDAMGVPNGAELVADLNPAGSSTPRNFAFTGDRLFFTADDGVNGEELWVIDFPTTPTCIPDFNGDTTLNDDDLGEFITSYFEIFAGPGGYAVAPCDGADVPFDTLGYRADITGDCTLNDDDLSLYITLFFIGCE